MELESPPPAAAAEDSDNSGGDRRAVLAPECIPLFADGISFILSRCVHLQEIVADTTIDTIKCWYGKAEYIRLTLRKVKHEVVDKMAADILASFLQPEVHCPSCIEVKRLNLKEPCDIFHVEYWLCNLTKINFGTTVGHEPSVKEAAVELFNLHLDLLQGKCDSVDKLKKTITWIGEDEMKELRSCEDEGLRVARSVNKRRRISRRERLKFRAYFV